MSDANRTQVGIIEESTFGTTPASPKFETLRVTGEPNLAYQPTTIASNEIRSDRQVTDLPLVDKEAAGNIDMELAAQSQDVLMEGAFFSDWVNKATRDNRVAAQITSVTAATDVYAVTTGTSYAEYMLVEAINFTNSANNGVFEAESGSDDTEVIRGDVTVDESPPTLAQLRQVGFVGPSADIAADATGLTSTLLDFTTMNLAVGDWVKVGGTAAGDSFATAANNAWVRVSVIAANDLDFDSTTLPAGWSVDAGTGKTIKVWVGDYIRNGTTQKNYSIERQFQDQASVLYELFTGMTVDTFNLSAESAAIVDTTFAFIGKDSTSSTTRTSGATDQAALATEILNTSSDVGSLREGGSEVTTPNYVISLTMNIANNLRSQKAVANTGNVGIGVGEATVTGSLVTYFGDNTLLTKVLNNTESSLDFRFKDDADNVLLFDMPRIKFSSGAPDVSGKNTDVTAELGYQAIRDATLTYTVQAQRYFYTEE